MDHRGLILTACTAEEPTEHFRFTLGILNTCHFKMSSRHTEKRRIKAFDLTADNLPLKGVTSNLFIMMVKWMLVDGVLGGGRITFMLLFLQV